MRSLNVCLGLLLRVVLRFFSFFCLIIFLRESFSMDFFLVWCVHLESTERARL